MARAGWSPAPAAPDLGRVDPKWFHSLTLPVSPPEAPDASLVTEDLEAAQRVRDFPSK